ncbi:GNAT family N-acetyltransferase [Antarcticibacterium flavum]|uniref:GNAT family N-acetyltransferase n=1 Tax=Antarcticibacterium flavum TaxID=2058175 RepID=A0A5B7X5B2_9FLAO|nr:MULTISPECIES: GNAT family N-acetyltransferase [Antarcticibacterium]MCM4159741.1 GNAT family N-acetyltransferase [Antarcticibacterium sp. W02-3]QCY70674.1 GNAT family N-acetyltransferase [Antarcticibacterium flavum]
MIEIKRTNSRDPDLPFLINLLDRDLAVTDGDEHAFYDQFNKIDLIKHVVILYQNEKAVSCGALKEFIPGTMEIKRMFTKRSSRGKGYAGMVLNELEEWAKELHYSRCILETGVRQPDAIALYRKHGYELIPNYGQYEGVENSHCFGKNI